MARKENINLVPNDYLVHAINRQLMRTIFDSIPPTWNIIKFNYPLLANRLTFKGYSLKIIQTMLLNISTGFTDSKDKDKVAPSYALFDLNMGYDFERFSVYLNVFNLSNKQFMEKRVVEFSLHR